MTLYERIIKPLNDRGNEYPRWNQDEDCWNLKVSDGVKRYDYFHDALPAAYRLAGIDIPPHIHELLK